MGHHVYTTAEGKDSMAYINEVPWHGLGQKLTPGADLEVWKKEAGMNWNLKSSPVCFLDENQNAHVFSDQKVLFRDDTNEPLSVVHRSYNEVQPGQVLDFFQSFVKDRKMTIETAGTLDGGKKMWALARIDYDITLNKKISNAKKDVLQVYCLLATSCDKSLASTARLTTVRVVCWNTLSMAYSDNTDVVKVSHRTAFSEAKQDQIKRDLGLIEGEIEKTEKNYNSMVGTALNKNEAIEFFLRLFDKSNNPSAFKFDELPLKKVSQLWDAYHNSPGSNMPTAESSLWGAVNAVSYVVDHNPTARTDNSRLNSAWFGQGAALKNKAVTLATEIIEEKTKVGLLDQILDQASEDNDIDRLMSKFTLPGE